MSPQLKSSIRPPSRPEARLSALALAALGLLALGLCACAKPEKSLTHSQPISLTDRVLVLNADSLVIDGKHVHLSNASTPQGNIHSRCWAEALLATNEIAYVRDLVAHAQTVDFKPNGQIDAYNRALGEVRLDGVDLGEELYQHGMAARLTDPRFDWCQPISQQADGAPPLAAVANLGN